MNTLVTLPIPDPRKVTSDVIKDMRARATWAASLALGLSDDERLELDFVTCRAGWIIVGRFEPVLSLEHAQVRELNARFGGPSHKQYEFTSVCAA